MPVNQNDSMSATAVIGYHLYISHDLNTLKACNAQGPELQCLLRVKEDLSKVLIFQDAKNNV